MPTQKYANSPNAKKEKTHCSTEMTCRCFSILDLQGQNAKGRSCRAERILEPVPGDRRWDKGAKRGEFYQNCQISMWVDYWRCNCISLRRWEREAFGDKSIWKGAISILLTVRLSLFLLEPKLFKGENQTKQRQINGFFTQLNNAIKHTYVTQISIKLQLKKTVLLTSH